MHRKRILLICLSLFFFMVIQGTAASRVRKTQRIRKPVIQTNPPMRCGLGFYGASVKMVLGKRDRSNIDQWFGIHFRYLLDPHFSVSFRTAYGWVQSRDPQTSHFSSNGQFKTMLFPATLSTNIIFTPKQIVRPYLSFGVGTTYWDVRDIRETATSLFAPGTSVYGSKTQATLVGGLGFEIFPIPNMSLDFFGGYHHILKGDEDTIGSDDDNRAIVEARVGLNFYWTTYKDTDKDGIEDQYDRDPMVPEDYDGFQDKDGIPDLDNDRDGIPDRFDKAPLKAEDPDGYRDKDGIPDPDNDRDGIPDIKDKCPNEAEDMDGFEDEDGCPDKDNDNDGIPDSRDKCPDHPETVNNYMDYDGCPDEKPQPKPAEEPFKKMVPVILKGITFRNGSAELAPLAQRQLLEIGQIIAEHEHMKFEIRGYTDATGSPATNLRLSQQRATAVRQFLIGFGIRPERLRPIGLGNNNPIATNATPEGRAMNRRIEFVRIE